MAKYETKFIPQNKAPINNDYICVYDGDNLIGKVKTSGIKMPNVGNKLYSFGVFSDVHVNSTEASSRFRKAVKFLADTEKVNFICIAGDLTNNGTEAHLKEYINLVSNVKSECTNSIEIHDTTGNHDVEQGYADKSYLQAYADGHAPYTTRELYYSFTQGDDVFIMFGMTGWPGKSYNSTGLLFSEESLEWLESELEKYKDKRCFLFEHAPYFTADNTCVISSGSGAIVGLPSPTGTYISRYTASEFKNLLARYGVIWFHGHSHMEFFNQNDVYYINYCVETFDGLTASGIHSIHIPSLAVGRQLNADGTGWGAPSPDIRGGEGYVVDVYEHHIVLRGRDFVNEKFIPIATYCLETTP